MIIYIIFISFCSFFRTTYQYIFGYLLNTSLLHRPLRPHFLLSICIPLHLHIVLPVASIFLFSFPPSYPLSYFFSSSHSLFQLHTTFPLPNSRSRSSFLLFFALFPILPFSSTSSPPPTPPLTPLPPPPPPPPPSSLLLAWNKTCLPSRSHTPASSASGVSGGIPVIH